ncbi:MAG: EscU/YscU/HrcU family type III secretion system export apparatus switch protein [Thermodesulfovibrionales bacterium]
MKRERKKAAALRYDAEKDSAPKVVAKGSGRIAERIIEIARQHNIPIKDDPGLVEVLSSLDLYQEIPPELYRAVAEILVFVYKMTENH